nr:helix-turn-helix domain-containing protein [Saccharofermentans sp.]
MLGENLKILRKQKGLSQETLAQQLNVVRQTVSKWEKGLSVPDAEMLNTISELFEVPVSTLLGSTVEEPEKTSDSAMEEIAKQLAVLNEQLATRSVRRRKTAKKILTGIVIAIAAVIVL